MRFAMYSRNVSHPHNLRNDDSSDIPENGTDNAKSDSDLLYIDIDRFLKIYYSIFLVTLGTAFNILSFIVLSRAAFRHSTTSVYFRFLACVDTFVLYNGLSRHFVSGVSGYNIRTLSENFCKFNQWSSSFAPDISAWTLVAVTTERVVSIVWPHKVKTICSRVTACATVSTISLVLIASNVPLFVFYGNKMGLDPVTNKTVIKRCVYLMPEYEIFMTTIWYWIDLVKFVILPATILTIFNALIVIFVVKSRRRLEQGQGNKFQGNWKFANSEHGSRKCPNAQVVASISSISLSWPGSFSRRFVGRRVSGANKEMSLTITLLVVNATFVICNTPIMVYLLGAPHWFPPDFGPVEQVTLTAAVMTMYTNNAVNFLLYCATGSRFRAEIRQLFAAMLRKKKCCCYSLSTHSNSECDGGIGIRVVTRNVANICRSREELSASSVSRETCCSHVNTN